MDEVSEILKLIGLRRSNPTTLLKVAEKGYGSPALNTLIRRTKLPVHVIFRYLDISPREVKKYKKNSRLRISVSDRILDLAKLYVHGIRALDSCNNFNIWLVTPLPVLDGEKPIDLIRSSQGLIIIDDILLRIEYSIPE